MLPRDDPNGKEPGHPNREETGGMARIPGGPDELARHGEVAFG
jgi:hypothetical protein